MLEALVMSILITAFAAFLLIVYSQDNFNDLIEDFLSKPFIWAGDTYSLIVDWERLKINGKRTDAMFKTDFTTAKVKK